MSVKQVIVLRSDLGLSTGKAAAQSAHASTWAMEEATDEVQHEWEQNGTVKVVVKAESLDVLEEVADEAHEKGLPVAVVADQGRTEIESGTKTAVGIGPADEERVDSVTGNLSLF